MKWVALLENNGGNNGKGKNTNTGQGIYWQPGERLKDAGDFIYLIDTGKEVMWKNEPTPGVPETNMIKYVRVDCLVIT